MLKNIFICWGFFTKKINRSFHFKSIQNATFVSKVTYGRFRQYSVPWDSLLKHKNFLSEPLSEAILRTIFALAFAKNCIIFSRCIFWCSSSLWRFVKISRTVKYFGVRASLSTGGIHLLSGFYP